jgi:hypothetical protein
MSEDNIKTGIMSAIKSQADSHIRWSKVTKVSETTQSPSSGFDMIQHPDCASTPVQPLNRSGDIKVTEQRHG